MPFPFLTLCKVLNNLSQTLCSGHFSNCPVLAGPAFSPPSEWKQEWLMNQATRVWIWVRIVKKARFKLVCYWTNQFGTSCIGPCSIYDVYWILKLLEIGSINVCLRPVRKVNKPNFKIYIFKVRYDFRTNLYNLLLACSTRLLSANGENLIKIILNYYF